jgi:hypothetical protein
VVKGERQAAKKGDVKKDVDKLQEDTIDAIHEKDAKGHLHKHDVGRRDTKQERMDAGGVTGNSKQKKGQ